MALLTLIFLEWALACFLVTTHALAVECAHAIRNQLTDFLVFVADHAISACRVNIGFARFSKQGTRVGEVVATLTAVDALVEQILVAICTASVDSIFDERHVRVFWALLAKTTFVAVSTVRWVGLDVGVVVTGRAVKTVIVGVRGVVPRGGRKGAVVTGDARRLVRDGCGVVFNESFIKFHAVTRATALYIVTRRRVLVVTAFTRQIVLFRVFDVVKNHDAASVIKADSVGGCLVNFVKD